MKYLTFSLAALIVGAHTATASTEICGSLPNSKWSWEVSVSPETRSDPEVTYGDVSYSGNSGNGTATQTTTVIVTPGQTVCTALNPSGNVVADKSTTIGGGDPYTEETAIDGVQVCFNSPNAQDLIENCR